MRSWLEVMGALVVAGFSHRKYRGMCVLKALMDAFVRADRRRRRPGAGRWRRRPKGGRRRRRPGSGRRCAIGLREKHPVIGLGNWGFRVVGLPLGFKIEEKFRGDLKKKYGLPISK
ncbi:hypothetical protein KSP39_PZI004595 [Platanthera zijinensis]|uniref:Uncharacterized protein n=1 Tax=Platanthera zijinensis TaxID=2320716 RepID=A0AAP0BVK4_9ASPA